LTFDAASHREVAFMGLAGETVTAVTSNTTFATACDVHLRLVAPGGALVSGTVCVGTGTTVGPLSLAADGTYKVRLVAGASATGSLDFAITSSGTISSITPNAKPVPISINAPHQHVRLGFLARAGEHYSAVADNGDVTPSCRVALSIVDGAGESIGGTKCVGAPSTGFVQEGTIPSDGVYYLAAFEMSGSATLASFHARLYRVTDVTGTITADGSPVALTIRRPGQNAEYSFPGTVGQRVSVLVSDYTINGGCFVSLIRPNGTQLTWTECYIGFGGFLDATTLDKTGTWTLRIDPDAAGPWVGAAKAQLFTVVDTTRSIVPGQTRKVDIAIPGENARVRFAGAVGDKRTVTVTDISVGDAGTFETDVVRPDGTLLDGRYGGSPGTTFDVTLDATGTWSIVLDPQYAQTGELRVRLD
jgi:hypothetical protein